MMSILRELEDVPDQVFVDDPPPPPSGGAWELSKENVLPLRAGRRVQCLNEAVARDSLTEDNALREERHAFETQLRGCSIGDGSVDDEQFGESKDPADAGLFPLLDIWHRYVNWTEQNYPSGKELGEIIQRSIQAFPEATGEMARVADHSDYVDLWLKLANQREEPGDIFQFMYSKKIGRRTGLFYEQWAWHLEDVANPKKASAVLGKGIANEASSAAHLEKLKSDLELRVAQGLRFGVEDVRLESEEGRSRKTLGDLRGKGKRMTAPNVRVGPQATIPGMRRGITGNDGNNGASRSSSSASFSARGATNSTASSSNVPSTSSSVFRVFSDENEYRDEVSDNKFSANPVDAVAKTKENTSKPTAWNKVRAKQKVSSIPTTPLTPSFDIHVDETEGEAETGAAAAFVFKTPAKTIDMTHHRPLSTKKVGKEPNKPLDFLEKNDDGKTEEKFMFCKDKVYQGLEEFSFEEMRFEMWKRRK